MARKLKSFRVGKVTAYPRGDVWYLDYFENGQRRRPRVGPDKDAARQLAAQTNAQLEIGAAAPLSFEPLSIVTLRERWLHYHEHVLRSATATVARYRLYKKEGLAMQANKPRRHRSCSTRIPPPTAGQANEN